MNFDLIFRLLSAGLQKVDEVETKFNGNSENRAASPEAPPASMANSPVKNSLTPTTSTLLGTVQRRLSFANTNLTEGRKTFLILYLLNCGRGTLGVKSLKELKDITKN